MAEIRTPGMAEKLLAEAFQRSSPSATVLSDPIADTPMSVTLDQLRPYEHDPRVKRNPAYEDIKASIRERGLDAPPAITRRPGDEHFIIRNGGNTRLAILRELWSETRQDCFYRISCLFRPWPARGEIVALTGHLAENELRGGLTFIERALGVETARTFYEEESGGTVSQSELARRLSADGYPVQQSHISRMQDAVRHLLPAIPNVLYGGLGRHQVERIAVMRKAGERIWNKHSASRALAMRFEDLFQEMLSQFDALPDEFSAQRVQDEMIGQMAELLGVNYDTLSLDLNESEVRQRALISDPSATASPTTPITVDGSKPLAKPERASTREVDKPDTSRPATAGTVPTSPQATGAVDQGPETDALLQEHIASPAQSTERLQSIQRLMADQLGDTRPPDYENSVLKAIPVQAGGLYPITDVWYIDPGLDTPERLKVHIAQFAREIAEDLSSLDCISPSEEGIGFQCSLSTESSSTDDSGVLMLLASLSGQGMATQGEGLMNALATLLYGEHDLAGRLSDTAFVKLFRLLRLARRLLDLVSGQTEPAS